MSETPFSQKLFGLLERVEFVALAAILGSLGAHFLGYNGVMTILVFAFAALAGIYFLMAYRPPAASPSDEADAGKESKSGFMALFVETIVPKVLWIGSAVGAAGLSILHTQPTNHGYMQMLLIQAAISILGMVITAGAAATGVDIKHIIPILYRAAPLALASVYILTTHEA